MEQATHRSEMARAVELGIWRFVLRLCAGILAVALIALLVGAIVLEQSRIRAAETAGLIQQAEDWRAQRQALIDAGWAEQMDEWRDAVVAQRREYLAACDRARENGQRLPPAPTPPLEPKRPEISSTDWPGWKDAE